MTYTEYKDFLSKQESLAEADKTLLLTLIEILESPKAEGGRIALSKPPLEWVREALAKSPVQEAPLTHEIAIKSRAIRLPHEDPADRCIAATALEYEFTLITEDSYLK